MIRIGIIDRDERFREEMESLLFSSEPDELIGEKPGVAVLFSRDTFNPSDFNDTDDEPHIVLIDIEGLGSDTMRYIRKQFPQSDIIVLSDNLDTRVVLEAFRNGAVSYVHKKTASRYLYFAITSTYKGGSFTSPALHRTLIDHMHHLQSALEQLTHREEQIAKGLIGGLSYKLIADEHQISIDTVRVYVKRIYRKLGINSRGELIAQVSRA